MRQRLRIRVPALRFAHAALVLILLGGCESTGLRNYNHTAATLGFSALELSGDRFRHRVYANSAAVQARSPARPLHVYIDGDGIPWRGTGRPALDPTARNPLLLRLMARDHGPAVYMGRPCYLGVYDARQCHPWIWTHGRYSEPVVNSMVAAVRAAAARYGARDLVLIGFSGGGSLAMLMAARLEEVTEVVTLAANLDLRAWTAEHGYSPLHGSLDPAQLAPLPTRVRQRHWVGADDRQVPPDVVRQGLMGQPGAQLEIIPGFDHTCCWEAAWPGLLEREMPLIPRQPPAG